MTNSYIPAEDALALNWMQTFAAGLTAAPATYQLTATDAAAITGAVDDFAAAYAIAVNPALRTPVTIVVKDDTRRSADQICRQYAILIKQNAGISDGEKTAIGVRPINPTRDPIPVPTSSPLLNIVAATPGAQTLRYADTLTPDSASKPFGASSLQLFVAIGDLPATGPDEARFVGAITRNPVGVPFDAPDDGKIATYYARWATRTGDTGPWSLPVNMRIAA